MKPKLRGLLVGDPNTESVYEAAVSVVFFLLCKEILVLEYGRNAK